jgi:sugar O-acyltransferase (sialic acid O-acetyltransferase NeuD family)
MKRLALIGTKDFSEQIVSFAQQTGNFEFVGYFDDLVEKGTIINGKPVLGKVTDAVVLFKEGLFDCIFEGIGYTRFDLREYYFNLLKGKVPFANIIMPTAKVASDVALGEGVFIGGGSLVESKSIIGDNVFIHGNSVIGHNNVIGAHSYISGRFNSAGFCRIGRMCFIGICVVIADHIEIVDNVWIGLGCIVAKNLQESGKFMSPAAKLYKIE